MVLPSLRVFFTSKSGQGSSFVKSGFFVDFEIVGNKKNKDEVEVKDTHKESKESIYLSNDQGD
jgi:hypothetical protein